MFRTFLIGASCGLFALALGLPFTGCQETSTFPCGDFGGWCETGVEVCVQGADECAFCVALEEPCTADDGCGCLDGVDLPRVGESCVGEPMCNPQGEGLVLTCERDGWGCG